MKTEKPKVTNDACPNCGYCPHCGRGGWGVWPYQPYPYPYTPGPIWISYPTWISNPAWSTSGGTVSNVTAQVNTYS